MSSATIPAPASAPSPLANGDALYEVVNGQRLELPPMSILSALVAGKIYYQLCAFLEKNKLGRPVMEGLFILDAAKDLRRRPDVAFVSAQRWPLDREIPTEGDWQVVPDLAVEVVSPNDLARSVFSKVREYFAHGVSQVWVVWPNDQEVYLYESPTQVKILTARDEIQGGQLIPGFRLPLAELFQKA